jgi:hypothetical protein
VLSSRGWLGGCPTGGIAWPTLLAVGRSPRASHAGWAFDGHAELVASAAAEQQQRAQHELNEDLRLYATLGDVEALRLRLLRGAEVDDVDDEGNTALLVAVRAGAHIFLPLSTACRCMPATRADPATLHMVHAHRSRRTASRLR